MRPRGAKRRLADSIDLTPRSGTTLRRRWSIRRGNRHRADAATGVLGSPYAPYWARLALRAGADMVLTTSARDAGRIVRALVPLARRGELDQKLVRVLRYRQMLGLPPP